MIGVLLVDDNPTIRATLRTLLEAEPGIGVVGEAGDGRSGLAAAQRLRPRVTLLDYRMPIADGLSVVEEVSACSAVLVLTNSAEEQLVAPMLRGGARGYLVYGQFSPPDLVAAVRAVAAGQGWLVPSAASVATSALRDAHARRRSATTRAEARAAHRESFGLSEREREVVELVVEGLSNADIADVLGLSGHTVRNHLTRAFGKLDVASRTAAIARWQGRR